MFPRRREKLKIRGELREAIFRQAQEQARMVRALPPAFRSKVPHKALIVPRSVNPLEHVRELTSMRFLDDRMAARKSR